MKMRHLLTSLVIIIAAAIAAAVDAQAPATKAAVNAPPALTAVQALPLPCAQAWSASGKGYAQMRAILIELAMVSLVNRELTLPNRREIGLDAGKGIAADCTADPSALLFAVVDKHFLRLSSRP